MPSRAAVPHPGITYRSISFIIKAINQPINQLFIQLINQSIYHYINHSIIQSNHNPLLIFNPQFINNAYLLQETQICLKMSLMG